MVFKIIVLILAILASASAVKKSYEGFKVYEVIPKTDNEVKVLKDIQGTGLGEFWNDNIVIKSPSKIMVAKKYQNIFLDVMKVNKLKFEETIDDLQKIINDQLKTAPPTSRYVSENFFNMTWDRYHNLDEIYNWLDVLKNNYGDIVTIVSWGLSNENRELKGIVIDFNPERENKVIGVIEGTLHAREWISPATVTWIIKELLSSTDEEMRALARNVQWHILPVANPDGYVYTFTDHRMWRKNRNTVYNTTCNENIDNDMSNGVDLNRNFGFQWMTVGASNDSCTNTFAGSAPFSEPESVAIANYVRTLHSEGNLVYYLAMHSYTQLVVVPYSHITDPADVLQASNYANMFEIGIRSASKLSERFGTQYRVGVSAEVLYPMSGTSFDWVKNETDVPVCYLLELRDVGEYGFLLPPEQIIPNNLEIMDFILEMDRQTRRLGYYKAAGSSIVYSLGVVVLSVVICLIYN